MKEKIRKALLDAGLNITGESYNELHLEGNIAIRIYNWEEEGVISWHIEDFKGQAKEYIAKKYSDSTPEKKEELYQEIFDESKFPDALERMIDKVDHTIGITWDTVDYYLHEYCLREEEF